MARSVTFNGITQFRPGGITRVNANALASVGLPTNGIVGLIGESEGGEPDVIHTLDDPSLAKETFRDGALADAVRVAFDATTDPRIPGGASRVLAIRTNSSSGTPSSQASRTFYSYLESGGTETLGVAPPLVTFTPSAGGAYTVDEFEDCVLRWVVGNEDRVIVSNTATEIVIDSAFSGNVNAGDALEIHSPSFVETSIDYGVHTNAIRQSLEDGATIGHSWTTELEGVEQTSDNLGATSYFDLEYIGQASRIELDSGTSTAGGAGTITDAGAAWPNPNGYLGYFIKASGGGIGATPNFRLISANNATQITVAANWSAPAAGAETYSIRRAQIINQVDVAIASALAGSVTLGAGINLALNELAGMVIAITSGTGVGQRRTITSHTAGASPVLTLDNNWTTIPTAASGYEIRYVTTATATIAGAAGVATGLTSSVAIDGAVAAGDLAITFTPGQTVSDLAVVINSNPSYQATVPSGVDTNTLVSTFDFDAGSTAVDIRSDRSTVTTAPVVATGSPPTSWKNHFRRDLQVLLNDMNARSEYVTVVRSTASCTGAGMGIPEYTAEHPDVDVDGFVSLSGGVRGTSDNADFQDAFDELLKERCNFVIPLISADLSIQSHGSNATFAAVAAQLVSHVELANGSEKTERGGLIGMDGTKAQLLAQAASMNCPDVQLCGQKLTLLDVDGNLVEFPEWGTAVAAASMRSGAPEVGEPLTWKYIKTTNLTQDAGWDPKDTTDANQMIEGGILFAEFVRGKGYRWVRDLTTWIASDNLAFMEGSVRDAIRYVAYNLRVRLEDKFTGIKAKPANAASIKDEAIVFFELCRSDSIIVDSLDGNGTYVPGYRNVRVTISGDIARIRAEIFPVVGINFQLNDIYLQLPTSAA